jgi:hypothetical protein
MDILSKLWLLDFALLSPCISMNQIKIKRPTNALFNYFNVVSLYHPTCVSDSKSIFMGSQYC